jgi:hypothetical protein
MSNITRALLHTGTVCKTQPLYQYDYGQLLQFVGIDLPQAYEVHFSNEPHGEAVTQIGNADGVTIPDALLTTGLPVYAWLFLHTGEEDGETEYAVTIPVIRRAAITDDPPTPVEQSAITQAIAALNSAVEQTAADAEAAAGAAELAEGSAELANQYMESALTAKTAAETAQAHAEDAEDAAKDYAQAAEADRTAAQAAKDAAETAQGMAEDAETDAITARNIAQSAQAQAEGARDRAILAELNAQTAKNDAQTARSNAQQAQAAAERARAGAETAERGAQTAQTAAETAQAAAETARSGAETAEHGAQTAQGAAENAARAARAQADAAAQLATDAEAARDAAMDARNDAEDAKDNAILAGEAAQRAQTGAEAAQDAAEAALAEFTGVTAVANTLPAGSPATASYHDGTLTLGIPKGDPGEVTQTEFDTMSNNVRLLQDGRVNQNLLSGCVENSSNDGVVFTKLAETKIKAVGTGVSQGSYYRFFFSNNSFPDWMEKGKKYYVKFRRENVNLNLNYYLNGWRTLAVLTGDGTFICPADALGFSISLAVETVGVAVDEIVEVIVTEAPLNETLQEENDSLDNALKENASSAPVNLLADVNWEIGSISAAGTEESTTTRIRTTGYIDVSAYNYIDIDIDFGYKFVRLWFDENKSNAQTSGWQNYGHRYEIPDGVKYVRFVVANTSDTAASLDYSQHIRANGINGFVEQYENLSDKVDILTLLNNADRAVVLNDWIQVGRNASGANNVYNSRVSTRETVDLIAGDKIIIDGVLPDEGQKWIIQGTNGTSFVYNSAPYVQTSGTIYTVATPGRYWATIAKGSEEAIAPEEVSAKVYILPAHTVTEELLDYAKTGEICESLYIDAFKQGGISADGDTASNYRISSKETIGLPIGSNRVIEGRISTDYVLGMRTGASARDLNHVLYWYTGMFAVTVPEGDNYYRLYVARNVGGGSYETEEITPKTAQQLGLTLTWKKQSNVLTANQEAEKILSSARLKFNQSFYNPNTLNEFAVIAHTSDPHGDYERVKNFFEFSDKIGADMACVTGDIVSSHYSDGAEWFKSLVKSAKTKVGVCIGNHECEGTPPTDSDIYTLIYDGIAEKVGNTIGKTWYYTDIDSKKLRIISVNLYQDGGQNGGYRFHSHMTDEQLAFIASALSSTPSGYGVLMLSHAPQLPPINLNHTGYDTFYQLNKREGNGTHNVITGGVPIYDLVDAFIGRTTVNKTYTQPGTPSSISVSADFSSVDSSVEFIAHLTGHIHCDSTGYVQDTTHKQLMLNVICTNAIYGGAANPYLTDLNDMGRNRDDATQDAFNVYVIDRGNKAVKIVRIGANMTYDLKERKYMVIPYAD